MAEIAFFGLGTMGVPMAINLLKAGHHLHVLPHNGHMARWPSRNTEPASMRRCKRPRGMQSSSSVSSLTMPPSGTFI